MTLPSGHPDEDDWRLSETVVEVVAERAGRSPTDLPPLYTAVDPEALDAMFRPTGDGSAREGGSVSFPYAGYRVRIVVDRGVDVTASKESP